MTREGQIVWEYVNGFTGMLQFGGMKRVETGIYRCYRVPYGSVPDLSSDFERDDAGKATHVWHPPPAWLMACSSG